MKSTGIVRRVDDLGRIVIPKEIRKNLLIAEGCPMEIYLDGDCVIFKVYDPLAGSRNIIERAIDVIHEDIDIDDGIKAEVLAKMVDALCVLKKKEGGV